MANETLQTRALVVLGPFRGGTSLTCGVLHQLGVFVGKHFWNANSQYCTYEALGLRNSCNACFDEHPAGWNYQGTRDERIAQLKQWMDFARRTAAQQSNCGVGGKHPTLCKLVDEVSIAWRTRDGKPPLFISVIRPIDEVLAAWEKATNAAGNSWWRRPDRGEIVADLIESRDKSLQQHQHIEVNFDSLRSDPRETIRELAMQCSLPIAKIPQAVQLVRM